MRPHFVRSDEVGDLSDERNPGIRLLQRCLQPLNEAFKLVKRTVKEG